jgi:hypothetical protein
MTSLMPGTLMLVAFNLVCTGTETSRNGSARSANSVHFRDVYRVDVRDYRWCRGECAVTRDLTEVTATTITFEVRRDGARNAYASVNRETGTFSRSEQIGDTTTVQIGRCERVAFTGFPSRRF